MTRRWLCAGVMLLAACDKPTDATTGAAATSASASAPAVTSAAPSAPPSASAAPDPSASAAATAPVDAIIAQHVLVAYKGAKRAPKGVTRSKAEAKARAQEAAAKAHAPGTPFEDVVKQYSDDAGTVDRLGSLGKFRRDAMDPAFSAAAFALKPGEISDPVETPFGFHVIKRTQ